MEDQNLKLLLTSADELLKSRRELAATIRKQDFATHRLASGTAFRPLTPAEKNRMEWDLIATEQSLNKQHQETSRREQAFDTIEERLLEGLQKELEQLEIQANEKREIIEQVQQLRTGLDTEA